MGNRNLGIILMVCGVALIASQTMTLPLLAKSLVIVGLGNLANGYLVVLRSNRDSQV
jgi:uncharacterized protein YdbL (DUF1318 family)